MKIMFILKLFLPVFLGILNQAVYLRIINKLDDLLLPVYKPKVGMQDFDNIKTYMKAKKGKLFTDWLILLYYGSSIAFLISIFCIKSIVEM